MTGAKILVVEDESIVALAVAQMIEDCGYEVAGVVASGEQAVEMAGAHRPALILMDVSLRSRMDGVTAATTIAERYGIPSVFMTAFSEDTLVRRSGASLAAGILSKPFQAQDLKDVIVAALERSSGAAS